MVIQTTCRKCGVAIRLDFGSLSKEEALAVAHRLDNEPCECPGSHCELSGMAQLWSVREAIRRLYDLDEGEEAQPVESDETFVSRLVAQGNAVYDGGLNTVPQLRLPSIHEVRDLEHVGFGNFANATDVFMRRDSAQGTRFYVRQPRAW